MFKNNKKGVKQMKKGLKKMAMVLAISISMGTIGIAQAQEYSTMAQEVSIESVTNWFDSATVYWNGEYKEYNVYYRPKDGVYIKADDELVRGNKVDLVGLIGGSEYEVKIVPVIEEKEDDALANVTIVSPMAVEREGFAFSPKSTIGYTSGGYNQDGTIAEDAVIVYVTEENKNTVTATFTGDDGKSYTGVGISDIMLKKKKAKSLPMIIRFIGTVIDDNDGKVGKGTNDVIGLVDPDSTSTAGVELDIKEIANITFEGVGDDATLEGWGLRVNRSSNIVIRNLIFNQFPNDAILIQNSNEKHAAENIFIHNNTFYPGKDMTSALDSDMKKGDGTIDICAGADWITISYNRFVESGKTSLVGLKGCADDKHVMYHHNYFDTSGSRHPRARKYMVHVVNNYFKGNDTYGIAASIDSEVFVESNYFENVKRPIIVSMQGHAFKSYLQNNTGTMSGDNMLSSEPAGKLKEKNNYFDKYSESWFDPVNDVNDTDFPFEPSEYYSYNAETPEEAKIKIEKYAGVLHSIDGNNDPISTESTTVTETSTESTTATITETSTESTTVTVTETSTESTTGDEVMYGDADEDGVLTGNDAAVVLQYVLNSLTHETSEKWINRVDVDKDGIITANDCAMIMQKVLNSHYSGFAYKE